MNKDQFEQTLLEQAYEESRYHRQFHHLLFGSFLTFYTAILSAQISSSIYLTNNCLNLVLLFIGLYVLLPFVFIRLIWTYHERISILNVLIGTITKSNISKVTYLVLLDKNIKDAIYFQKYIDGVKNTSFFSTGSGHPFFIGIIFSLIALNVIVTNNILIIQNNSLFCILPGIFAISYLIFLWVFFKNKNGHKNLSKK